MRKEKETTLSGKRLRVTQLGFEDSLDLMVVLTKALGPSLGALATDSTQIAPALSEFAKQLSASDFKYVVNTLAKSTRINRESDKWPVLEPEVDLAGEMGFLFKWLGFALEVNFGDFLGGTSLAGLAGLMKTESSYPATSDGTCTASAPAATTL